MFSKGNRHSYRGVCNLVNFGPNYDSQNLRVHLHALFRQVQIGESNTFRFLCVSSSGAAGWYVCNARIGGQRSTT